MDLSYSGAIAYVRTKETSKKLRYAGVSVVFVPLSQILIQVFGLWLDNYTAASLLTAAIVIIPNFFANKHFVWRVMSRENLRNQVLVFWLAVMLGVSLATAFTHLVEIVMADQTRLICGTAVFFAQLLGYGIVWVGRFLIMDRWLFAVARDMPERAEAVVDDFPA
jgi:putative flippase GtrA